VTAFDYLHRYWEARHAVIQVGNEGRECELRRHEGFSFTVRYVDKVITFTDWNMWLGISFL